MNNAANTGFNNGSNNGSNNNNNNSGAEELNPEVQQYPVTVDTNGPSAPPRGGSMAATFKTPNQLYHQTQRHNWVLPLHTRGLVQ